MTPIAHAPTPQSGPPGRPRARPRSTTPLDDFEWIIYVRISDDREGAGLGVKRQEDDGRALHKRAGLGGRILCVLTDNDLTAYDKSGRYKPRPDYEQLCALLQERPGRRGVIAWHTDRLHRSPRELEDFIDLIEATGAPVQTVKAGIIDLSTASGRMTARVHCAVARHESEHKSERIRRKVEELAEAGSIYGGGPRPYGYNRIYDSDGPRRKILRDDVDPAEAAIIRELARRALAGDTLRTLVRWLNREGITTSTGRQWSQQGLRTMLTSGRIAGLREHRGQVVAKAVWDPIITVEQHEQLRVMLRENQRPPGSRVRIHYLSGFVYCSNCVGKGVKMRVAPQHGKLKYKCLADIGGCNGRVIGLADLEELIGRLMVAKMSDPKTLRELAAREADATTATAGLVEQIEADERRLVVLKSALDDGDEDDLPEVVGSIREIRQRLRGARAEFGRLASVPKAGQDDLPELASRWPDLDLDQKQRLLRLFVSQIIIHPAVRGLARFDPGRVEVVPAGRARAQEHGA
ncbi:recombinase family protein [Micromonospora aurantiaca]|uniref:recombinase family protein n=1 Tax=Micromonospora aurantiaca (nom. illeg.) TaxID=47850 RepID=UPI0033BB37F6